MHCLLRFRKGEVVPVVASRRGALAHYFTTYIESDLTAKVDRMLPETGLSVRCHWNERTKRRYGLLVTTSTIVT